MQILKEKGDCHISVTLPRLMLFARGSENFIFADNAYGGGGGGFLAMMGCWNFILKVGGWLAVSSYLSMVTLLNQILSVNNGIQVNNLKLSMTLKATVLTSSTASSPWWTPLSLYILKMKKSEVPVSDDCPLFFKFSLAAASTSTASGPSTNWPINCHICWLQETESHQCTQRNHVVWSYNMPDHIQQKHGGQHVAEIFELEFGISQDERIHLKIEKGQPNHQPVKHGAKRKLNECGNNLWGKKAWN